MKTRPVIARSSCNKGAAACNPPQRFVNRKFQMTLFEKIIARQIPAKIVYEDDLVLAFHDVDPKAPVHVLLIPKKPIARIGEATSADAVLLGHLLLKAPEVAALVGVKETGFRLVINHGAHGGESVPHLHVHILGGRQMKWPPG